MAMFRIVTGPWEEWASFMLQGPKLETTLEPETNRLVRCGCTGIMELWPAKVFGLRTGGSFALTIAWR